MSSFGFSGTIAHSVLRGWGDAQATSVKVEGGWLLKLRFTLTGCAQLHAFLVKYPGARRECDVIEGLQGRLECVEPS